MQKKRLEQELIGHMDALIGVKISLILFSILELEIFVDREYTPLITCCLRSMATVILIARSVSPHELNCKGSSRSEF